jgi:NitT/TauT family transport system substrate-binding protein
MRRQVTTPAVRATGRATTTTTAVALATAAVLLLAAGCGGPGQSEAESGGTEKVTVGAIPIVDVAPLHLGKKKGFFKDEGIDLEIVNTTGGAAAVPGVVSGDFDFAFGNIVSLIVARSENLPLKAVASGNSSTGENGKDFGAVVVPGDSDIDAPKDLAGKRVAINNLKNISDTTVRASVRKDGGDPTGVRFSELPFPEMPAAVAKHQVDAAMVVEPFLTIAKDQGAKVVASNFVDAAPDLTIAVYFTTDKLLADDPDLAERFAAAISKSLEYADQHPDEARAILPSYTQIEPGVADKITLPAWPQEVNQDAVQQVADLMHGDGLIKEKIDVAEVLP